MQQESNTEPEREVEGWSWTVNETKDRKERKKEEADTNRLG